MWYYQCIVWLQQCVEYQVDCFYVGGGDYVFCVVFEFGQCFIQQVVGWIVVVCVIVLMFVVEIVEVEIGG